LTFSRETWWLLSLGAAVLAYITLAYLLLPAIWRHHEHQPKLAFKPMVTLNSAGIAGDPLNVGLVGNLNEIMRAMTTAGWNRADPLSIKSDVEIAESVALDRPYKDAPVSSLFYQGRREDIAFEKAIGTSAAHRHHVRFWKVLERGAEDRNVWLGSATLDRDVGFSRYTGQITHHIAPDIDAERQFMLGELTGVGVLSMIYSVSGIGPTLNGRNGEGDWYYTDGEVEVAVISPGANSPTVTTVLDTPTSVAIKNKIWHGVRDVVR
jgi:LssY-like putative type I secretion system component LssY